MRLFTDARYDLRNTIVISGSPRSGTTWAAQAVSAIPGSAVLFEPLNITRVPDARRAGFSWRTYVRPGTQWDEGERLLEKIMRGRVLNPWTVQELRRPRRVRTWIVKFIEANRMLPWLTERFPVRSPLLLVRHPCAVIASQLAARWVGHVEDHDPELEKDFPQVRAVLDAVESPLEHRAARWAIDLLVPLSYQKPHPWITLPYEWLALRKDALDPAFDRWNLERPVGLSERMDQLSSTVLRSKSETYGNPVTNWTATLKRDDVRSILSVTHALGVDLYGDDPEPDDARLARWM